MTLPDPPEDLRRRLRVRGGTAAVWADDLPRHAARVLRRWDLVPDGRPMSGGTSAALPVRTSDGERAVLKLVSPLADAAAEARALALLADHGAIRLLRADAAEAALLLERADGGSLATHPDAGEAVRIAGALAARVASCPAPPGTPRLADQAPGWTAQLHGQHRRALIEHRALPAQQVTTALETIEALGEDTTPTLTHGDLSFANVMRRADGSWVLIDPALLAGPAEHEAHTVLRSLLDRWDPAAIAGPAGRALRDFCAAAGLDAELAWRISHARAVSSAYAEAEHGGPAAHRHRLEALAALPDLSG